MVIIDTNIIIDHLRSSNGSSKLIELIENHPEEELGISIITIQELYEGKSTKKSEKETDMLATIGQVQILPYDYNTAKKAGELARDLKNPIELADAAIAATAIINGAPLYTINIKHFQNIPDLKLF